MSGYDPECDCSSCEIERDYAVSKGIVDIYQNICRNCHKTYANGLCGECRKPSQDAKKAEWDLLAKDRNRLRLALAGILEIGKRNMTNSKYDGYFEEARAAIEESIKGFK